MAVEFEFPLRGGPIPQEHGYLLMSGLTVQFPFLHERKIQVAPVGGTRSKDGKTLTLNEKSRLHVRGLTSGEALQMRGGYIWVGDNMVFLGPAHQRVLRPSSKLVSRVVVLRDIVEPDAFVSTLREWVPEDGVKIEVGRQRALSMKGMHFKGYRVTLSGLTPERSEKVLAEGLGRFHTMGCGVFAPLWEV